MEPLAHLGTSDRSVRLGWTSVQIYSVSLYAARAALAPLAASASSDTSQLLAALVRARARKSLRLVFARPLGAAQLVRRLECVAHRAERRQQLRARLLLLAPLRRRQPEAELQRAAPRRQRLAPARRLGERVPGSASRPRRTS